MRILLGLVLVGACVAPETLDEVDQIDDAVATTPALTLARTFVINVTNGTVNASATDGATLYLGGHFNYIGERSGQLVEVAADTGKRDKALTELGGGAVFAIVPDVSGGYYVGGDFRKTGSFTTRALAHLRADGTWDPAWRFSVEGEIYTLARDSARLYVAGSFTMINGVARHNFAALDLATGALVDGTPSMPGMVRAMTISTENHRLFLGGDFDGVDGFIERIDLPSLTVSSWNPGPPDGPVKALLAVGSGLYVGGGFTHIGSAARNHVASIDQSTAAVRGYNPSPDSTVFAMQRLGSVLYLGGDFTTVGGQPRGGLAAVNASTGALLPMVTNFDEVHQIQTLYPTASALYVGGDFRSANGTERKFAAAVNPTTGALLPWNPHASDPVLAIAPRGSAILLGGVFVSVNGSDRANFAAIDLATGKSTSWAPNTGNERPGRDHIDSMALRGSTLWVGGQFLSLGGQPRRNLGALSTSGAVLPFRADAEELAGDPDAAGVGALAVTNTRVYVGGRFTTIAGQPRANLAAVDPTSGAPLGWAPTMAPVHAIVVAGPRLYAGGFGQGLGAWDVNAVPQPVPSLDGSVDVLAYDGTTVYVGGRYATIGGQPRNALAATVPGTATVTSWNPPTPTSSFTAALGVSDNYVYASDAVGLQVFSKSTGAVQSFSPKFAGGTGMIVRPDRLIVTGMGQVDYIATSGVAEFLGTP